MARIPESTRMNLLQTQVPAADTPVQGFGMQDKALSGLGETIATIGNNLMVARKKAEDSSYGHGKAIEDALAISDYSTELKNNTPANGDGYAEKMQEFVKSRFQKNLDDAPSDEAGALYESNAQAHLSRAVIEAQSYQNQLKVQSYDTDAAAKTSAVAKALVANPDYTNAPAMAQQITDLYDSGIGTIWSEADAKEKAKKALNTVAHGLFDGLSETGQNAMGMKLLKENFPLSEQLTEKEYAGYMEHYKKAFEAKNEEKSFRTKRDTTNIVSALLKGDTPPDEQVLAQHSAIDRNPKFDKATKLEMHDQLNIASAVGKNINDISNSSPSQLAAMVKNLDQVISDSTPPGVKFGFNNDSREIAKTKLMVAIKQSLAARNDDSKGFVVSTDKNLQQLQAQSLEDKPGAMERYLDASDAKQQKLGLDPQVLSKSEMEWFGKNITAQPSPAAKAQALAQMQTKFGSYYQRAMDEVIANKENGVPADYQIASQVQSNEAKTAIIENIENGPALIKNYKNDNPGKHELIVSAVSKSLDDMRSALAPISKGGATAPVIAAFQKQLEVEAIKNYQGNTSRMPMDAVGMARKRIVDSSFQFFPTEKGPILAPKVSEGEPVNGEFVSAFAKVYLQPENLKTLDLAVPPEVEKYAQAQLANQDPQVRERSPITSGKDLYLQMLAKNGRWATNSSQTGVFLTLKDPETGAYMPAMDSQKKIIQKSFKDISLTNDKKVLDQAKTGLQFLKSKIFGD